MDKDMCTNYEEVKASILASLQVSVFFSIAHMHEIQNENLTLLCVGPL